MTNFFPPSEDNDLPSAVEELTSLDGLVANTCDGDGVEYPVSPPRILRKGIDEDRGETRILAALSVSREDAPMNRREHEIMMGIIDGRRRIVE